MTGIEAQALASSALQCLTCGALDLHQILILHEIKCVLLTHYVSLVIRRLPALRLALSKPRSTAADSASQSVTSDADIPLAFRGRTGGRLSPAPPTARGH